MAFKSLVTRDVFFRLELATCANVRAITRCPRPAAVGGYRWCERWSDRGNGEPVR